MCDCDGWTSAAILINYLTLVDEKWAKEHVKWIQHKGKQHGLKDLVDVILEDFDGLSSVFVPDAGSNDREEHERLRQNGINVCVLDHHEIDRDSDYAIVVNVQLSNYPNKSLTGAGVAWQFCRAFDEVIGYDFADRFIDLAALGNCGDMSDYRELETRALINIGLANIKNPFFYGMAKKNDYSIQKMNGINYYSVAFYIVPYTNCVIRSGTMDEKELVFKSFLIQYAFDDVMSSKRGHTNEKVKLYDEAVLIAERVKRRQTKLQDEAMEFLEKQIKQKNLAANKIIVCLCEPGDVETGLQGLVANKLMAKYQKPCLVLTKNKTIADEEYFYRGSGRNYGRSELKDLRQLCLDSELVEYAAGHASAFGTSIAEKNIEGFIATTNKMMADINDESVYWVDYIWNAKNEIDGSKILGIADLNIYGQEIPESYIALNRIPITPNMVTLMGVDKGHPTLKIQFDDISLIKFKSSKEEYEKFLEEDLVLTAICKCNKNEWNGKVSPQLLCEEYELNEEFIF